MTVKVSWSGSEGSETVYIRVLVLDNWPGVEAPEAIIQGIISGAKATLGR